MQPVWILSVAALSSFVTPPLRLVVNLPAYRLEAFIGDSLARTVGIAPGMPNFSTPRGEFAISSIDWNPRWTPPPGRAWTAGQKAMAPGPLNPIGPVKLNFQPLYFLHGTPLEASIGTASSHGCIRMKKADAIELARLVHRFGTPSLSTDDVGKLAGDLRTTRHIPLERPIPLDIRYDLVEVRQGRVWVYRDVYSLATRPLRAELFAALAANGVDTLSVDESRVHSLLRRIGKMGNSTPIDSLVAHHDAMVTIH